MSELQNDLIVALDIGTSKVLAIVAEILPDGQLEITGVGMHPSRGMRKGIVVNIDATVQSVQRAIEEAELMSGCQIHTAFTGISGSHIHSFNSHGFVAVKSGEVTKEDMARVIEAARAVSIPAEQKILHVLPQEYTVDHQNGIIDPVGMSGIRLEGKIHIVTAAVSAAQNIVNCVRRCGQEVDDIVLEQLACSQAVLTEDEKQLGVCLIDIGAGTTGIAVYADGAIRHTSVLAVAGDQVTNDLAVAFRTPHNHAEHIKVKHGCAYKKIADKSRNIKMPNVGQNPEDDLSQADLADIIEPRYEELFALILDDLQRAGWHGLLSAGVVLTGGSAKMYGALELAAEIFQSHVRLGVPRFTSNMPSIISNPIYSTGVGLILYGHQMHGLHEHKIKNRTNIDLSGVFGRVKSWFQGNF
ncbi:MAG TPA: cell division protein FtsA [Gammaproteobacteria bacterium]|nr:cell division protein FtsA [Gammaproteobacteria bacterium]